VLDNELVEKQGDTDDQKSGSILERPQFKVFPVDFGIPPIWVVYNENSNNASPPKSKTIIDEDADLDKLEKMEPARPLQHKPGKLGEYKGWDALKAENHLARDTAKKAGLNKDQRQELQEAISGENYDYHRILEIAKEIAEGKY
jgi:hypothetical protein